MRRNTGPQVPRGKAAHGATVESSHSLVLLLVGAAASLGLLSLRSIGSVQIMEATWAQFDPDALYWVAALPILALVVWLAAPRQAPGALLLAGVVLAAPELVLELTQTPIAGQRADLVAIASLGAPLVTAIGVVAAATTVWRAGLRAGLRAAAGSVIALALLVQPVGSIVMTAPIVEISPVRIGDPVATGPGFVQWTTLTMLVIAAVGAIAVAVATDRLRKAGVTGRASAGAGALPDLPLTAAAGAAVLVTWLLPMLVKADGTASAYHDSLLRAAIVMVVAGLAISAVGGLRIAMIATSVGAMTGAFTLLTHAGRLGLNNLTAVIVTVGLLSLVAAVAGVLWDRRRLGGVIGLFVVGLSVLVLSVVLGDGGAYQDHQDLIGLISGVLIVVAVGSAASAIAGMSSETVGRSSTPAVIVVLPMPVAAGVSMLGQWYVVDAGGARTLVDGVLPPAGIALLLAAGLATWLLNLGVRAGDRISPDG